MARKFKVPYKLISYLCNANLLAQFKIWSIKKNFAWCFFFGFARTQLYCRVIETKSVDLFQKKLWSCLLSLWISAPRPQLQEVMNNLKVCHQPVRTSDNSLKKHQWFLWPNDRILGNFGKNTFSSKWWQKCPRKILRILRTVHESYIGNSPSRFDPKEETRCKNKDSKHNPNSDFSFDCSTTMKVFIFFFIFCLHFMKVFRTVFIFSCKCSDATVVPD